MIWLVVSTPLKNNSQWEGLSHILWKIKNVPNHQPVNNIYISLKNQPCADDSPNHRSIVDRLRLLEFSHRRSTSLAPFNPPLPRADTITWQRLPRTPLGQGISCDMNPTIHFWPVIENGL